MIARLALVCALLIPSIACAQNSPELESVKRDLAEIRKDVGLLRIEVGKLEKVLSGLGKLDAIDKKLEKLELVEKKLDKLDSIDKKLDKFDSLIGEVKNLIAEVKKLTPVREPIVVSCNGCNLSDAVGVCTSMTFKKNATIPVPGNTAFVAAVVCYD